MNFEAQNAMMAFCEFAFRWGFCLQTNACDDGKQLKGKDVWKSILKAFFLYFFFTFKTDFRKIKFLMLSL